MLDLWIHNRSYKCNRLWDLNNTVSQIASQNSILNERYAASYQVHGCVESQNSVAWSLTAWPKWLRQLRSTKSPNIPVVPEKCSSNRKIPNSFILFLWEKGKLFELLSLEMESLNRVLYEHRICDLRRWAKRWWVLQQLMLRILNWGNHMDLDDLQSQQLLIF